MFNANLKDDLDVEEVRRSVDYEYARINSAITQDWTQKPAPISALDKRFMLLTEGAMLDGTLINETVMIVGDGPVLDNNLQVPPLRFSARMDLEQLFQSRLFKSKSTRV